ncbi:MAG: sulfite exporter TauE/SafE family protein [Candidatus Nanopelagicales bacterium]|nr:sulfite exporter TauE/SafE family protein [Candidatus Nanopelagicales bacterium]MCF8536710.1 sulfite exporter TauE/SafE family protein [Candidatus Nanopelagicales bacterium]MCF8541815.1 sulfite exporter TauE/SafE family protein [Candidatus Nanopelagicales bacterium]MCF8557054.1 sulfite exporter TauE/SafE family protein [Candidatus Nanopelagicales bacterium]
MLALATGLSVFIGIALGLLGGGGSILTVPLLVYVAGLDAKAAIASSLFVVGVTSIFGLISHARAHRVRWRTGLIFGAAGMVGAFAGGKVGALLPGALLLIGFAVMMAITAIAMIRGRKKIAASHHGDLPVVRVLIDGVVVGFVTGIVGAGGGFLVVPALALLGGLPMPIAVGTSLLVIGMKSFAGFAGYASSVSIDWQVTLLVTAGAIVGAFVGSAIAGRIHPDRLRKGFGWFVLAMAAVILAQELGDDLVSFGSSSVLHALGVIAAVLAITSALLYAALRGSRGGSAPPDDAPDFTPDVTAVTSDGDHSART